MDQGTRYFVFLTEYISVCQACKDIVWATRWIEELGSHKSLEMPIHLCGDNKGALDLVKNLERHAKLKHVNIQYHYVREVIQDAMMQAGTQRSTLGREATLNGSSGCTGTVPRSRQENVSSLISGVWRTIYRTVFSNACRLFFRQHYAFAIE